MLLDTIQDYLQVFGAPAAGDIIRYNATLTRWEVAVEPLRLKGVILDPMAALPTEIEGYLVYHAGDVYVAAD